MASFLFPLPTTCCTLEASTTRFVLGTSNKCNSVSVTGRRCQAKTCSLRNTRSTTRWCSRTRRKKSAIKFTTPGAGSGENSRLWHFGRAGNRSKTAQKGTFTVPRIKSIKLKLSVRLNVLPQKSKLFSGQTYRFDCNIGWNIWWTVILAVDDLICDIPVYTVSPS